LRLANRQTSEQTDQ